jgi:hypothetical protein
VTVHPLGAGGAQFSWSGAWLSKLSTKTGTAAFAETVNRDPIAAAITVDLSFMVNLQ